MADKLIKDYSESEIIAANIILHKLKDKITSLVNELDISNVKAEAATFEDILNIKSNVEELLKLRLEAALIPNMFFCSDEEREVSNSKANEYINE